MPPNLKQIPSPQLRIRLILMIFLLSENDADMTDNSFCTFWEKLPALMALCLLFFKHSGIARLLSLLVSKIDKIRNCLTFFQKYAALIAVF